MAVPGVYYKDKLFSAVSVGESKLPLFFGLDAVGCAIEMLSKIPYFMKIPPIISKGGFRKRQVLGLIVGIFLEA